MHSTVWFIVPDYSYQCALKTNIFKLCIYIYNPILKMSIGGNSCILGNVLTIIVANFIVYLYFMLVGYAPVPIFDGVDR